MNKTLRASAVFLLTAFIFMTCSVETVQYAETERVYENDETVHDSVDFIYYPVEEPLYAGVTIKLNELRQQTALNLEEHIVSEPEFNMEEHIVSEPEFNMDDVELIALITMAEAEGECEEGKRLVIDTILNRVDSEQFPDTIREVVYQKNQFSSVWNGRVDRVTTDEYIYNLVKEEIVSRTNTEVIFFTAGEYGKYGTPLFAVEHHYFSSL